MSFEEEFDKIIRQKSDELHYSFDESNWEKAARLLDAERKSGMVKQGGGKTLVYLFLAALTGISVWAYLSLGGAGKELAMDQPAVKDQPAETRSPAVEPLNETAAPAAAGEAVQLHTLSGGEKAAASSGAAASADLNELQTTSAASSDAPGTTPRTDESPVAAQPGVHTTEKEVTPATVQANSPVVAVGTDPVSNSNAKSLVSAAPAGIAPLTETSAEEHEYVQFLPGFSALIPVDANVESVKDPFTGLAYYDDDYYALKKHRTTFVDIEAGVAYLRGWNTAAGQDGKGLNWFGGFNYGRHLSRNILLIAGIQLYGVEHINQPFHLSEGVHYHFSSTTTGTFVMSNELVYAAIPLQLGYRLGRTGRLSAGVNAAYLLQSTNTVQSYSVLDNVRTYTPAESTMGVYDGVNRLSFSLTGSYAASLGKRLMLKGEVIYGLSDIFVNNSYSRNQEKPAGLRLSLQYTLLSR